MDSNFFVITNCTGRKRGGHAKVSLDGAYLRGTLASVAGDWVSKLSRHRVLISTADAYYGGRAFQDARHVADNLSAPLGVVSAGLGLIWSDEAIPAYDLTISAGSSSVGPYLRENGLTTPDWWEALNAARGTTRPIDNLLLVHPASMLLLALPSPYLKMVATELETLPQSQLQRIRIFSSTSGTQHLSQRVKAQVMPYDLRLEATRFAGTQSDFPQRAMRHFVDELGGHELSLSESIRKVAASMHPLQVRTPPVRQRLTDDEIMSMLKAQWNRHDGAGGRLLRYLRDEALVACEQSRFKILWRRVQAELSEVQS